MAIAKQLPDVDPNFMQRCPFCERNNRIVVQGVYRHEGKAQLYPDIGYSFCNCRDIFYCDPKYINNPTYLTSEEDGITHISMPDPFFCEWGNNPSLTFLHWDPRKYSIIWDMHRFCEYLTESGYEVLEARRDFDTASKTPQHFHIKARYQKRA